MDIYIYIFIINRNIYIYIQIVEGNFIFCDAQQTEFYLDFIAWSLTFKWARSTSNLVITV